MKKNYENLLDAFRELSSVSDEEIMVSNFKKTLKEGKSVSLAFGGSKELDDAKEVLKQPKEDTIEVIDVNANTLEHIKDNKEYIGQAILQCVKCHANKFIDLSKLAASEEDEEIYNVQDECPNCHTEGDGFELIGQVGKVVPEVSVEQQEVVPDQQIAEEPQAEADNDAEQQQDEVKFENDEEELAKENAVEANVEEPKAEEEAEEEAEELDFTPEEESDGLETLETEEDAEFDLPELGDVFDSDAIRADDTSDDIEEVEEEVEEKPEEIIEKPVRKKLRLPTHEAMEKIHSSKCTLTEELIHKIALPEAINKVIVSNGKIIIYEGLMDELPEEVLQANIDGFNVANGYLSCNIDTQEDEVKIPLAKILNCFDDDDTTKIIIWDAETNQELFQGCKADAINKFGHYQVDSFDAPRTLHLTVKGFDKCVGDECAVNNNNNITPEEKLCDRIFLFNDLAKYNVDDPKSEECWIAESVYAKEDLKIVFDRYVKNTSDKLIEEFKTITGYKDELDEMCDKYNVKVVKTDEALTGKDFDEMLGLANKLGIVTLNQLQSFAKDHGNVKDRELLAVLRKAVAEKTFITEEELFENVRSFKTRKELSEALSEFKANNVDYKVKRSKTEGYRYDVFYKEIQEAVDPDFVMSDEEQDDYLQEAKKLAEQIKNYSLIKCEELYYDDYGFDNTAPEDEAEQLIADALVNRIKEITTKAPVIANEALEEDFEIEEDDDDDNKQLEEEFAENTGDDFKDKIGFLTNDELEAIAGYKEVIEFFKEKGIDEDKIMDRLLELQADEEEHLEELKELYTAITGEEMVELPEEEVQDDSEHDLEGELVSEEEPVEGNTQLKVTEIDPSTIAPTDEALTEKYTKQELIDAVIDAYGYTQKEALDFIKTASEETKVALVQGFKQQAKNNFYNEAVNIKPFFKDENQEDLEEDFEEEIEKGVYTRKVPDEDELVEEKIDFDTDMFDEEINKYFDEAYEDTVLYRTESGVIDKQGNIMLEGIARFDSNETKVTFNLTPTTAINEALEKEELKEVVDKTTFKVTNNLSEEVFIFSLTNDK